MRALVVYCHPREGSFTAAVRDTVLGKLGSAGAETTLIDLYASGFNPVLDSDEHERYLDCPENCTRVESHVAELRACDTLIFVYPTWWYGPPAMLKGWLDRVLLPDVAFLMPDVDNSTIRPALQHIKRLGVFTTCGANRWLTWLVGAPGKRTFLRGVGFLCARPHRTAFAAHYLMDKSTDASRKRYLELVAAKMDRLLK